MKLCERGGYNRVEVRSFCKLVITWSCGLKHIQNKAHYVNSKTNIFHKAHLISIPNLGTQKQLHISPFLYYSLSLSHFSQSICLLHIQHLISSPFLSLSLSILPLKFFFNFFVVLPLFITLLSLAFFFLHTQLEIPN